jgi:hypothetical protein
LWSHFWEKKNGKWKIKEMRTKTESKS